MCPHRQPLCSRSILRPVLKGLEAVLASSNSLLKERAGLLKRPNLSFPIFVLPFCLLLFSLLEGFGFCQKKYYLNKKPCGRASVQSCFCKGAGALLLSDFVPNRRIVLLGDPFYWRQVYCHLLSFKSSCLVSKKSADVSFDSGIYNTQGSTLPL